MSKNKIRFSKNFLYQCMASLKYVGIDRYKKTVYFTSSINCIWCLVVQRFMRDIVVLFSITSRREIFIFTIRFILRTVTDFIVLFGIQEGCFVIMLRP